MVEKEAVLGELPKSLDELVARALTSNPDVAVREAAVREAEALLNQARLAVTQKVVNLYFSRREQQQLRALTLSQLQRAKELHGSGHADRVAVQDAEMAVVKAGAEFDRLESDLRYVVGIGSSIAASTKKEGPASPVVLTSASGAFPEVTEKLSRAFTIGIDGAPIAVVAEMLHDLTGVSFYLDDGVADEYSKITIEESVMTGQQILQLLADRYGITFVLRNYGVLVTAAGVDAKIPQIYSFGNAFR